MEVPHKPLTMVHMITAAPTYPVGLRLEGRRVVVVGGGQVAQRRIPALLNAGADLRVVAPECSPTIEGWWQAGQITWEARDFTESDLRDAWYVLAATDSAEVNESVLNLAEANRVFCVRCDDATRSTAVTPAVGTHGTISVAVLGETIEDRDPRRSARVRDSIVLALQEGVISTDQADSQAGVTLVGGGPGDPDLITVAGRKALARADVVIADRLAPQQLLGELPAEVELIDVAKLPRGRSAQQSEINRLIVQHALAGKNVVRFKGGDSFVFGRGYEEVQACVRAGVPVAVIPGISSPLAVPAMAGIPITHRGVTHEFTVVSGHLPPHHPDSLINWSALAMMQGTLVLMMAVDNAPAISKELVSSGRSGATPTAVICDGSLKSQRRILTTLAELPTALVTNAVRPPAIIIIGDVVGIIDG